MPRLSSILDAMNRIRAATPADIAVVLPMMREFYAHERLPYEESRQERLLSQLIAEPRCGRLVVLEDAGTITGYMVLGFGFSVEFGGRDALLDELFVKPEFRGRGIGTRVIEAAVEICRSEGIEAIHLEADHANVGAHELYLRLGFKDHPRHLMTKWLK